ERQFQVVVQALRDQGAELPPSIRDAVDSFREASSDAAEAARRVLLITRDLRMFSHPDEMKREAVDIHKVLESSIRMAQNALRGRARLERRFGDNLLVNAAQAIPERTDRDDAITLSTSFQDGKVVVDITDTGIGIPADAVPRIFDIFFTTKPVGVGT